MNALTNQFQESGASHSATDTAAAAAKGIPSECRGGQAPFHVSDEVVICLPLPPTTNNLFASDGKRRFRSSEYTAWIDEAGLKLNRQKPPLTRGMVSLLIEVAEPKTKRQQDLGNREKATTDLLVRHQVIEGDDQRYVRELNMRWADIQGVRVTIRPLASVSGE